MRITLLGTGSPILDVNRGHSSVLVEAGDDKLLFDSGRGVTTQMAKIGINPTGVRHIFITHHHFDHICDLGEFLMTAWHNGHRGDFRIHGPRGTNEIVNGFLEKVFARDIEFAVASENAFDFRKLVDVNEIAPGLVFDGGDWKVFCENVSHGHRLPLSREHWDCFGYRIEAEGKVVAISGDTVACEGLDRLARNADCLIQCCYLAEAEITNPAFENLAKYVIASSGEVGKIAAHNKAKKLVLTHFRPKSEALMRSILNDVRRDYDGEIVLGEDLMRIEV